MGRKFSGLIGPPMQHIAHNAAHLEGHWNGPLTNLVGWLGDSASCLVSVLGAACAVFVKEVTARFMQ